MRMVVGISVALVGCGYEPPPPLHGSIDVQLLRAENQSESPFGGIDALRITVEYGGCLSRFYAEQPNWRADGLDGGPVFREWADERLCGDEQSISCERATIEQQLDGPPRLTIDYLGVTGTVENRVLTVGPLPTTDLAECSDGELPTVTVPPDGFACGTASSEPVATGESITVRVGRC